MSRSVVSGHRDYHLKAGTSSNTSALIRDLDSDLPISRKPGWTILTPLSHWWVCGGSWFIKYSTKSRHADDGEIEFQISIGNNQPAMKWCAAVSVVTAMLLVGVAGSPVPQEGDASLPTWRTRGVKPVQEDKAAYIKLLNMKRALQKKCNGIIVEKWEEPRLELQDEETSMWEDLLGRALVHVGPGTVAAGKLLVCNRERSVTTYTSTPVDLDFTTISNNKPCTVVPPKDWIAADVGVDVRISDEYTVGWKISLSLFQKLEAELVTAVEAGAVAEAVRMEQQLEDEILVSAVRTLYKDRDDKEKLEEDKKMIAELVKRDKRAVELLSGVLGSSSGGGSSGGGEGSEDGGGSNILSLITPLLGSSSGGAGENAEGGGSDILGLIAPLLGGLSGPANFPDPATNTKLLTPMLYRVEEMMKKGEEEVLTSLVPSLDSWEDSGGGDDGADGGGSNVLSLLSGLLGGSSGGGGDGEAGGGSNVLSLLSGLLGSSSGGGGDGEDGGGSNVLSLVSGLFGSSSGGGGASVGGSVSYKGATYDDLIKQSRDENSFNPLSLLTNSISQVLQLREVLLRMPESSVANLHVQYASTCHQHSQKIIVEKHCSRVIATLYNPSITGACSSCHVRQYSLHDCSAVQLKLGWKGTPW
ncbi:unnamed protein product [Timema podura]|uniref:Uncharacterized protein n=1 Tax=Timema podura TaxID=61482 RepID=A0ABN7NLW9_TIMPD|nr:unnamed protein product [Timema podura]